MERRERTCFRRHNIKRTESKVTVQSKRYSEDVGPLVDGGSLQDESVSGGACALRPRYKLKIESSR